MSAESTFRSLIEEAGYAIGHRVHDGMGGTTWRADREVGIALVLSETNRLRILVHEYVHVAYPDLDEVDTDPMTSLLLAGYVIALDQGRLDEFIASERERAAALATTNT